MHPSRAWRGDAGSVENSSALAQRMVEKELAIRIENVENEIGDGNVMHEFGADFFPAEALLERAEGQGLEPRAPAFHPNSTRRFRRRESRLSRQGPPSATGNSGNDSRYFIASARKNADFTPADVRLGADAIVLIFNRRILKIAQRLFGRFDRARQHEVDGMEKPEPCFGQLSCGRQAQSFADIAEQHVGALDLIERRFESPGDGFLDETFFQTDAQVSADDLHNVLGFERSRSL